MLFGRKRRRKLSYEQARQILIEQDSELGQILKWTTVPKEREQLNLFAKMKAILSLFL